MVSEDDKDTVLSDIVQDVYEVVGEDFIEDRQGLVACGYKGKIMWSDKFFSELEAYTGVWKEFFYDRLVVLNHTCKDISSLKECSGCQYVHYEYAINGLLEMQDEEFKEITGVRVRNRSRDPNIGNTDIYVSDTEIISSDKSIKHGFNQLPLRFQFSDESIFNGSKLGFHLAYPEKCEKTKFFDIILDIKISQDRGDWTYEWWFDYSVEKCRDVVERVNEVLESKYEIKKLDT